MAIRSGDQGFFDASGRIKTDAFTSSKRQNSSQTSSNNVDSTVKQQAASITSKDIAGAAVVKISSRLNAGGSGFENGIQSKVEAAVSEGLSNIAKRKAQATSSDATSSNATSDATTSSETEDTAATTESEASADESKYAAKTPGGTYQNEIIAASNKQLAAQKEASTSAAPAAKDQTPPPAEDQSEPAEHVRHGRGPKKSENEDEPEGKVRRKRYQDEIMDSERERRTKTDAGKPLPEDQGGDEAQPANPAVQPGFDSIA